MGERPALVIMAAGMGSRYKGLKQIDPIDEHGNKIIDFSIYDAVEAGFGKVVFIIKKAIEAEFRAQIGDRISRRVQVEYVFQELDRLPGGYEVPEGRQKPWGTAHAVLCCMEAIRGPFAVINADDYYGKQAFREIYRHLSTVRDGDLYEYAMVGYRLYNTLSGNGHVARGICATDGAGSLVGIHERTRIERHGERAEYTEDGGATWTYLPEETIVSLNLWGFTASILPELKARFGAFLDQGLRSDPLGCEYFLPTVVDGLLKEGKARVTVLSSEDRWYGVTYKEDKAVVVDAVRRMKEEGLYPQRLWEG